MVPFFKSGKSRTPAPKRKFAKSRDVGKAKIGRKEQLSVRASDEEIESDEEAESFEAIGRQGFELEDESNAETAQDKKLRLVKQYLQQVKTAEREKQETDDPDALERSVSKTIRSDYLESIGKLQRQFAKNYIGHYIDDASVLHYWALKLPVTSICITEDNRFIYVGNKNGVIVRWNLETTERTATTKTKQGTIAALAISYDMKFLVVADRTEEIKVLDGKTLAPVNKLTGHTSLVSGVVFRRNSHQLFSCSHDRTVKVWSLEEMVYVETLYGHNNQVTGIDVLQRERPITAGGMDHSIRLWKIIDESQIIFQSSSETIESVKFINDEIFVSCSMEGSLMLWNSGKKRPLKVVSYAHGKSQTGEPNWISSIATVVNSDVFASGSCDGFVRMWKLTQGKKNIEPLMEIPVNGFINALAFTSCGQKLIVAAGKEHRLGSWWTLDNVKNRVLVIPFELRAKTT